MSKSLTAAIAKRTGLTKRQVEDFTSMRRAIVTGADTYERADAEESDDGIRTRYVDAEYGDTLAQMFLVVGANRYLVTITPDI